MSESSLGCLARASQTDNPCIKQTVSSELLMQVVSGPSLGGMQAKSAIGCSLWFDMRQEGDFGLSVATLESEDLGPLC